MEHESDNDVEPELVPPEPLRVAQRSLVLSALTYRANIEGWSNGAEQQTRLLAWLDATQVVAELEPDEDRILRTPIGELDRRDKVNASWRAEGLAVLAWALGMMEVPPHDQQCPAPPIAEAFGFLTPAPRILVAPRVRPAEELAWYGEQIFAVHWRLRQYSLDHKPIDFLSFARTASFGPLEIQGLPMVKGDLSIRGVGVARSPDWQEVRSITQERHQAANWLLGDAVLYSDVGTDT